MSVPKKAMKSKKLTWAKLEKTRTIWKMLLEKSWIWTVVFAFGVVYLNLPSGGLSVSEVREGEVVTRDIILPNDFQVADEDATERKREEERKRIKPVFDFNPMIPRDIIERVSTYFSMNREKLDRGEEPLIEYEGLMIEEESLQYFIQNKFSTDLEELLTSLIIRLYRKPVVANKNFLMSLHATGYVEQTITTGRETESFDVFNPRAYPEEVREFLLTELQAARSVSRADVQKVLRFLMENIQPNLTYNALQTQKLRNEAAEKIHTIVRSYPAGTVLAQRGERLSADDVQVLSLLAEQSRASRHWTHQAGILITAFLSILFYMTVVKLRKVTLYGESPGMTVSITMIFTILFLSFVKILTSFSFYLSLTFHTYPFDQKMIWYYLIPFALGASIIQLVSGFPLVVAFSLVFSHFSALITGNYAEFFPYILAGSLAVALSLHRLRSRWDVSKAGFILAGINIVMVFIHSMTHQTFIGFRTLLVSLIFAFVGGILTAVLVSFLTPFFELIFGVTTDLRLLELATATHPVLKQLALSAPGTYIHSFNMSLLGERAAEKIGANPLIVRVGCLFHDIGKIKQPLYFIENQKGANPHRQLQPGMSRMVLRNHVLQGVEMAKIYHLPKVVIDAIRQHHGKKLMQYFYEAAREKDQSSTEDTDYRYPGPIPQSREMGIILLADAVEASARSLEDPTPAKFKNVVRTIIERSMADGQLDECPITLKEFKEIEVSFAETLNSMHHNRIAYPGYEFNVGNKEIVNHGSGYSEEKTLSQPPSQDHS